MGETRADVVPQEQTCIFCPDATVVAPGELICCGLALAGRFGTLMQERGTATLASPFRSVPLQPKRCGRAGARLLRAALPPVWPALRASSGLWIHEEASTLSFAFQHVGAPYVGRTERAGTSDCVAVPQRGGTTNDI